MTIDHAPYRPKELLALVVVGKVVRLVRFAKHGAEPCSRAHSKFGSRIGLYRTQNLVATVLIKCSLYCKMLRHRCEYCDHNVVA